MFIKHGLFLLFLQCLMAVGTSAQVYSNDYDLFTTRDGLPHNNVLSVLQDRYGLLWLGTYSGLSVYDGNSFKQYQPFRHQEDNWMYAIETIYEDAVGNVWIGTWGGLVSCFVRKEQRFREYSTNPAQAKVSSFCRVGNGAVWVGYKGGQLGSVCKDSISIVQVIGEDILSIADAGTDSLLLLSARGQYLYEVQSGTVYRLPQQGKIYLHDIDKSKFPTIAMGQNGFYVWGRRGLQRTGKTTIPQKNRSAVYSKVALSKNGYYYYTDGFRIYRYDSVNRLVANYPISDNITFNENNIINAFLEDRFGILWLGTTAGLYKIDQEKYQFQKYSINNKAGYLTHNYVRAVYIDRHQDAWIGFRSGKVNKLVCRSGEKNYVYHKSYALKENTKSGPLPNYSVNTIFETRDGQILIGGEYGLLCVKNDRELVPFLPENCTDSISLVWSVYEDSAGHIWIGTNGFGLFIYDRQKQTSHRYVHDRYRATSLPDNRVWKIFEDSRGTIWLGTDKGLVRATAAAGGLQFQPVRLPGTETPHVWSIAEDKANNLWVGTTGNGVFKMGLSSMKVHPVPKIKARVISAIVIDSAQNAWISTIGGLYQYNVRDSSVSYYSEDDGLLSNDFNFNAAAITGTGKIFLGAKTGLVFFDPEKIRQRQISNKARVLFTSLLIAGKDATKRLYNSNTVVLSHKEHSFSIDFALLDFSAIKPFRYRYRLQEYSAGWTYLPERQNRAQFHNVPPGDYAFIVQASDDGQHWYEQERELKMIIRPAFWQVPAFWVSLLALSAIGLVWIIRMRFVRAIRSERAQAEIGKQIAELELKALQAQMNPHFIFNTMNSIQHFMLHRNEVEANEYLTRFARLMRLVLESSKSKYILLKMELEALTLYLSLEQLRFENRFDFEINVAADIVPDQVRIPSLLIQPFVENAVQHGLAQKSSKGMLRLTFARKDGQPDCLVVTVDDNGIGRAKARKSEDHTSRGIQLIEDRIKTYNLIESRKIYMKVIDKIYPDEGTIVQIEIPL